MTAQTTWKNDLAAVVRYQDTLNAHPLFTSSVISSIEDVQTLMENHVYAVWDFMSLVKSLQHMLTPSGRLWIPSDTPRHALSRRYINEIVLGEETDTRPGAAPSSHFELYRDAMIEVGADVRTVDSFLDVLRPTRNKPTSLNEALAISPRAAKDFCTFTFQAIATDKPHIIASVLAYGRETVIPSMFRRARNAMAIHLPSAPMFDYYLSRHITLDGEEHGLAAEMMVKELCEQDPEKIREAMHWATNAITARIRFWTDVQNQIDNNRLTADDE